LLFYLIVQWAKTGFQRCLPICKLETGFLPILTATPFANASLLALLPLRKGKPGFFPTHPASPTGQKPGFPFFYGGLSSMGCVCLSILKFGGQKPGFNVVSLRNRVFACQTRSTVCKHLASGSPPLRKGKPGFFPSQPPQPGRNPVFPFRWRLKLDGWRLLVYPKVLRQKPGFNVAPHWLETGFLPVKPVPPFANASLPARLPLRKGKPGFFPSQPPQPGRNPVFPFSMAS